MEVKPQSHLLNIINSTKDHHPNFVLMLGAGASATSGVKLVNEIVKDWRSKHFEMYKTNGETFDEYLNKQHWYNKPEEYSVLFEKLYDQPSQRREFIESCIVNSKPSWGYIYLVNLLRNKVFNTVFTTNFDDLLNEACYLFSNEIRPIVCAHDSSISNVRISSNRPKIIKLHGDFLFDNIKNTIRELETLEQNTQDKFRQFANEYGFIFIGYSGNDRSIMDTLNSLLKFEQYFPHGIYWCIRKGTTISDSADLLTRFPKFKLIQIEGFDEFFSEVHENLLLKLQPEMSDPYGALAERLNKLMENISIPEGKIIHRVIEKDIKRLGLHISRYADFQKHIKEGKLLLDVADTVVTVPIPYGLLSGINMRNKKYDVALYYALKELENKPSIKYFINAFSLLYKSGKLEYEDTLFNGFLSQDEMIVSNYSETFTIAIILINNDKYNKATTLMEKVLKLYGQFGGDYDRALYDINTSLIKRLKGVSLTEEDLENLLKIKEDPEILDLFKMGVDILLEDYEMAEEFLKKTHQEGKLSQHILSYPIFDLIIPHLKNPDLREFFLTRDKQYLY